MCSPQLLRLQVGISARLPSTTSTATRRPQGRGECGPLWRFDYPSLTPWQRVVSRILQQFLVSCRAVPPDGLQ
eukprot:4242669-Prymnesium_polylepis.1